MMYLFVSLMQAFFVKSTLNLHKIAVGQANIRGITPIFFKKNIYIYQQLHKYPHHGRIFSVIGHFNENILPKTRYLKRIKRNKSICLRDRNPSTFVE